MIVYAHGSPGKPPVAEHTYICCPGDHLSGEECPDSFWEGKGEKRTPKTFHVLFRYGKAEVEDALGRYMLATGLAQKTRLVIPNSWDH